MLWQHAKKKNWGELGREWEAPIQEQKIAGIGSRRPIGGGGGGGRFTEGKGDVNLLPKVPTLLPPPGFSMDLFSMAPSGERTGLDC